MDDIKERVFRTKKINKKGETKIYEYKYKYDYNKKMKCELCGGKYTYANKNHHNNTKKHKKALDKIENN